MSIHDDAQRLEAEMPARSKALIAWLDSQDIPHMDRPPLLCWTAGLILSKAGSTFSMALLDIFIKCGVEDAQ